MPYVMDLHLFLSRPVLFNPEDALSYTIATMSPSDVHCGTFPRRVLDAELESMRTIIASEEMQGLFKSTQNAFKLYSKVRVASDDCRLWYRLLLSTESACMCFLVSSPVWTPRGNP